MKNSLFVEPESDKLVKPSLVPPWLALLLSLIAPGLGQIFARKVVRGLIFLASFLTLIGLLAWRIRLTARYDTEFFDIIFKAFRLDPYLLIIAVLVVVFYVWIAIDAYILASKPRIKKPMAIFAWLLVIFFMMGWQIGEINPVMVVTQADDAGPAISRVLWPWSRAITYPEEQVIGVANIQSPCSQAATPLYNPGENQPVLLVNPDCGVPTEVDGEPGTLLMLTGTKFFPDVNVEIWWNDPIGNEFRQRQAGDYVSFVPDENGNFTGEIIFPYRLLPPTAGEGAKIWKIEGRQVASIGEPVISQELRLVIEKMIETIFIGMMATLFGIILALPLSFVAARNLMSTNQFTLGIYYLTRTILNIVRSIEPLIWAIIFVIIVGLGPFAGILALTVHSAASLGKLYSEAIESIDPGPIEAVQATGANWIQVVAYAVLPQVIPPFVSFTIYRWDINIRMSTIIGFVGGGGIGFLLAQWIRLLDYRAAGLAVWFIAITVAILDYVSAEIRARYV
jgi:phosphonate transport system permease protein